MRNTLIRYFNDTWHGVIIIQYAMEIASLVVYWWLGVRRSMENVILSVFVLYGIVIVLCLIAASMNYVRRKPKAATVQLALCFLSMITFVVCLYLECYALTFSKRYADEFRKEQQWNQVSLTNGIPFSIEFRAMHPIYSWYESRVVFASGKRSGVMSGLHYPRAYDVIRLAPSVFSLMPMDVSTNHSCTYCVDVDKETVWVRCGAHLTAVPNESAGVVKRLDGSLLFNVRTDMIEVKDSPVPYGNDLNRLHCGAFEAPSAYEK